MRLVERQQRKLFFFLDYGTFLEMVQGVVFCLLYITIWTRVHLDKYKTIQNIK